ncbi:MAG: DUF5996 family protein [Gelidibacter sp.]
MIKKWPSLSYQKGKATFETLQLFTQIVGKIKLETLPWVNHSWHITLSISPRGLTTNYISHHKKNFQIDFDLISHQLLISTDKGEVRSFLLKEISVAVFYKQIFELLAELGIDIKIRPVPAELMNPIPFQEDHIHDAYDEKQIIAFHIALLRIQDVFMEFRSGFKGKCSPVHFFWGGFDLALSFFSGKRAPRHPGGIPGMPDWIAVEAYSREVSSCGFWTGNEVFPEAAFYCYLYPEPEGYKTAKIEPHGAYYHMGLGEFILPYSEVQKATNPNQLLLEFLNSTYTLGANLAEWDRKLLEDQ